MGSGNAIDGIKVHKGRPLVRVADDHALIHLHNQFQGRGLNLCFETALAVRGGLAWRGCGRGIPQFLVRQAVHTIGAAGKA